MYLCRSPFFRVCWFFFIGLNGSHFLCSTEQGRGPSSSSPLQYRQATTTCCWREIVDPYRCLELHVEAFLGCDGKLFALQERIGALLHVELLRNQALVLLGVELPGNEVFQIRIHLRSRLILLLVRAVEHVFSIAHAILSGLILPAECGRILEIHRATLIFRIVNGTWVWWITVSR